jgi:hypothetical protein
MKRKLSTYQLQDIDEERRKFIEDNLMLLSKAKMKPVNYGNYKVLWSFDLDGKSTLTLSADEYAYLRALISLNAQNHGEK